MTRDAILVFLLSAFLLFALQANRWAFTSDEGILLEPAMRMAAGERLYVDFFGYMSPGSYWLQALAFKLFGISIWTARSVVLLGYALQCMLVYLIAKRWLNRAAGAAGAAVLLILGLVNPEWLTPQHRWDSAALMLAGAWLGLNRHWFAGGCLAAAAALCTPTVALAGAALAAGLAGEERKMHAALRFLGGGLAVGAAALALLQAQGSLGGFFAQMEWLRGRYSAVNVMPYGSIIGGWSALWDGAHGFEAVIRAIILFNVALPALLPPFALIGILACPQLRRDRGLLLLTGVMTALILTAYPRADVHHLVFVSALPLALSVIVIGLGLPLRLRGPVMAAGLFGPLLFTLTIAGSFIARRTVETPIGPLRVPPDQVELIDSLLARVRPGQTLYVHPYMPVNYFLTGARNPTRFSYLAPGMMAAPEEDEVLRQLEANPPQWLMYLSLPREEFLRVFPNAQGLDNRFARIEDFLNHNYRPANPPLTLIGYQLWEKAK